MASAIGVPRRTVTMFRVMTSEAFIARLSTRNQFWHRVCSMIWRLAFSAFSSRISVPIRTSGLPEICCTEISPAILPVSDLRICSTGGS